MIGNPSSDSALVSRTRPSLRARPPAWGSGCEDASQQRNVMREPVAQLLFVFFSNGRMRPETQGLTFQLSRRDRNAPQRGEGANGPSFAMWHHGHCACSWPARGQRPGRWGPAPQRLTPQPAGVMSGHGMRQVGWAPLGLGCASQPPSPFTVCERDLTARTGPCVTAELSFQALECTRYKHWVWGCMNNKPAPCQQCHRGQMANSLWVCFLPVR